MFFSRVTVALLKQNQFLKSEVITILTVHFIKHHSLCACLFSIDSEGLDPDLAQIASLGFTGCLSAVFFNSISPLKAALLHPKTSPVTVTGPLIQSICGFTSANLSHATETTHHLSGKRVISLLSLLVLEIEGDWSGGNDGQTVSPTQFCSVPRMASDHAERISEAEHIVCMGSSVLRVDWIFSAVPVSDFLLPLSDLFSLKWLT